jgi:MFS transporter, FHS family, L-fucose permease
VTETRANTDASLGAKFLAGAQGAFALGRFAGVFFMRYIRPRKVFLFYLTMCIVFIGPAITQRQNTGMAMLYVTLFFESICFPTIVALGMRGLGKYSKRGSGFIVGGVCGGAVVPPILGATADAHTTALAMVVPMCFFIAAWTYSLAVNFVPSYRIPADKFSTTAVGIENLEHIVQEEEQEKSGDESGDVEKGGARNMETTPEIHNEPNKI